MRPGDVARSRPAGNLFHAYLQANAEAGAPRFVVAFLFSGCINVLMLATPLYTLQVFETVVPLGSIETLVILTLITAAAIAAMALIEIARDTDSVARRDCGSITNSASICWRMA